MRRPLLGLAALALERLEQDRLLAQHVRALDRPDREPQVVARAEDVGAEEARLGRRADRPPTAAAMTSVSSAADGDERLARADGERGDREALDDGVRVAEPAASGRCATPGRPRSRWRRRSDVGLGARGGPPLVAGREAGAAAARAGRRRAIVGDRGRSRRGRGWPWRSAVERAGGDGGVEVGRVGGVGAGQQDARPVGRGREQVGHGQAPAGAPWRPPPLERRAEGATYERLRRPVLGDRGGLFARAGGSKRRCA